MVSLWELINLFLIQDGTINMDHEIWRTLDEIFVDESERWLFETYLSDPSATLMEMANMREV